MGGAAAQRWANVLYSRPISIGVHYFINNLTENKSSIMSKNEGRPLKQKAEMEIEDKVKTLLAGKDSEPIIYALMFRIMQST